MRIMLVCRVYPTHRPGGMPFVTQDRAEALAKLGHDVHVVTTSIKDAAVSGQSIGSGSLILNYTVAPTQRWSDEFSRECERIYHKLKPDICHSDSGVSHSQWWAGKRVCVTMHGFGFGTFLTQWNLWRAGKATEPTCHTSELAKEADALKKAAVVIGVSKWERRMLRDQYGLKQAKLVYNPIPQYFFDHSGPGTTDDKGDWVPEEPVKSYFLCAAISQGETRGFNVCKKAIALANDRLRALNRPEAVLKIVGSIARRDMPAIYDGAYMLLLPTAFAQGFDLCIAEARARGVGAIMSATGSYLDEARDLGHEEGSWDRLVDIGDVNSLAHIIENVMRFGRYGPPPGCADAHRPETHAENWLAACC